MSTFTKSPITMLSFRCSGLLTHETFYGRETAVTHFPWTLLTTSAAIRGSISTAVRCLAFSSILTVRLPVPGPTSRTRLVGYTLACMNGSDPVKRTTRDATNTVHDPVRMKNINKHQTEGIRRLLTFGRRYDSSKCAVQSGVCWRWDWLWTLMGCFLAWLGLDELERISLKLCEACHVKEYEAVLSCTAKYFKLRIDFPTWPAHSIIPAN